MMTSLGVSRRLSMPLSLGEVAQFGDAPRELFVKSGGYSLISVEVGEAGATVGWNFSSEPKSISFGLVYREGPLSPPEESKVPTTLLTSSLLVLMACYVFSPKIPVQGSPLDADSLFHTLSHNPWNKNESDGDVSHLYFGEGL